jgi:streptomycin 6-kinase
MDLPGGVQWLRAHPGGSAWLDRVPSLVEACARRWSLRIGVPFEHSYTSVVFPVEHASGAHAVLKLQFPDRESRWEAEALLAWAGNGAVRLLEHEPQWRALLIERCDPGTPLSSIDPERALGQLIGLVGELSIPPPGTIGSLEEEADRWATSFPVRWERAGRPFSRRLVDAALDAVRSFAATQGPPVLLNQDLHGGNVLRARRLPWLVIDPKPLVGERAFQAAPIVRSAELGASEADVRYRVDRLCDELDLDRDRVRGWTIAQTVAWSLEGDRVLDWHVRVAEWMLQRG